MLRQLLAWERDLSGAPKTGPVMAFDDRIYVLTPNAAIVELPQGGTAVDFAYTVHTDLGHRCRGARVDGVMVPLQHPALQNGQTVEVTSGEGGRPSRDWLNPEPGVSGQPACASKRCLVQRPPMVRPLPAGARQSKSCCSAKARPPSSSTTWPPSWGFAQRTNCLKW